MTTLANPQTKIDHLRSQLPATQATAYFNAGTNGPLSIVAHDTLVAAAHKELHTGRIVPGIYESHAVRNDRIRALLAETFHALPAEFALTRSTTEGLNIALHGLDWERGDEVVTTNLEHPGLITPLALLAHRYGLEIRVADIGRGDGDVIGAIHDSITPRTRVIALSHLIWSSGAILPLDSIVEVAHDHGALVIVDAAQSAGQIPVNLHALEVDVYAIAGQKWLCGPEGTGAVFIRQNLTSAIRPTFIRYAQADISGYLLPASGARRYEMGESYSPSLLGLEATLIWLKDDVGWDWLHGRINELGRLCWDTLAAIPSLTVTTPRDRMAGLVCFSVEGFTPQAITSELFKRGITIRYVAYPPGPTVARVAVGWWNTEEEISGLGATLAEIIAAGPEAVSSK